MDLKRDIYPRAKNVSSVVDQRPLFEKYNFLSPGMLSSLPCAPTLLDILTCF